MNLIPEINARHSEEMNKLKDSFEECEVLFWSDRRPENDELVNAIKETSKQTGMKVYAVHLPNYYINGNYEHIQKLINVIHKMNSVFEPKIINMHCLYAGLEEMKSNLKYVLEKIPEGIIFTVENMTGRKANLRKPETVPLFLKGLDDYKNFGICFDTTHLPITHEANHTDSLLEFIALADNKLKHLHFSDVAKNKNITEENPRTWLKHQPLGSGIIDWKQVKEKLNQINYKGKATLEYLLPYKSKVKDAVNYWKNLSTP